MNQVREETPSSSFHDLQPRHPRLRVARLKKALELDLDKLQLEMVIARWIYVFMRLLDSIGHSIFN